jgi:hypothetical protein
LDLAVLNGFWFYLYGFFWVFLELEIFQVCIIFLDLNIFWIWTILKI